MIQNTGTENLVDIVHNGATGVALRVSGGNAGVIDLQSGAAPPLSPAGWARMAYNTGTNRLEISENGGAYQPMSGNTLDEAYDQNGPGAGRTITVDNGAVQLDNRQTTGTVEQINVGGATVLAGTLTGVAIDLATNVTGGANQVDGITILLPGDGAGARRSIVGDTFAVFRDGDAAFGATAMTGTERLRVVGGDARVETGSVVVVGTAAAGGRFSFDHRQTSGTIGTMNVGAATVLAGTLTGVAIDLATNVTGGANQVDGITILLPGDGAGARRSIVGDTFAVFRDGDAAFGATAMSGTERLRVVGGDARVETGSVVVVGTAAAGGRFSFDHQQTSGTIGTLNVGAATVLAGTLTGVAIDLATNVTGGANQVDGITILLPGDGAGARRSIVGDTFAVFRDGDAAFGATAMTGTERLRVVGGDARVETGSVVVVGTAAAGGRFSFDHRQTSGTIGTLNVGAATVLAGTLTGVAIDLATNVTGGANQVDGITILLPGDGAGVRRSIVGDTFAIFRNGDTALGSTAMLGAGEKLFVNGTLAFASVCIGTGDGVGSVFQIASGVNAGDVMTASMPAGSVLTGTLRGLVADLTTNVTGGAQAIDGLTVLLASDGAGVRRTLVGDNIVVFRDGDTVIGGTTMFGTERLRVQGGGARIEGATTINGATTISGKLTVTGPIDPTDLILSGAANPTLRTVVCADSAAGFAGDPMELRAGNATGTDLAGGAMTVAAGRGTGVGVGGAIILQTAPAGPAGAVQNALVTRNRISQDGALEFVGIAGAAAPALSAAGEARMFFNSTTNLLQVSLNGGGFVTVATGGATSLDGAYDAGRTITVDAGPVQLSNSQTTGEVLFVNHAGALVQTGVTTGINIDLDTDWIPDGATTTFGIDILMPQANEPRSVGLRVRSGTITCPDGASAERFGASSRASSGDSCAFGSGAVASVGTGNIAIGQGAAASGATGAIAIGDGAIASGASCFSAGVAANCTQSSSVCVGSNSAVTAAGGGGTAVGNSAQVIGAGAGGTALGDSARVQHADSMALGRSADTTAANQLVMGSETSPLTHGHFGQGVVSTTSAPDFEFRGTGIAGSTTAQVSGALTIVTGTHTGTGAVNTTGDLLLTTGACSGAGAVSNTTGNIDIQCGVASGSGGANVAGSVSINSSAGASRIKVNDTGLSFFGGAPIARPAAYAITNGAIRRSFDTTTVTLPQLAEVVSTILSDLGDTAPGYGLLDTDF